MCANGEVGQVKFSASVDGEVVVRVSLFERLATAALSARWRDLGASTFMKASAVEACLVNARSGDIVETLHPPAIA